MKPETMAWAMDRILCPTSAAERLAELTERMQADTLVPREEWEEAQRCRSAIAGMVGYLARWEKQEREGREMHSEDAIRFVTREVERAMPDRFAAARARIAEEESLVDQATRMPGMVPPREAA